MNEAIANLPHRFHRLQEAATIHVPREASPPALRLKQAGELTKRKLLRRRHHLVRLEDDSGEFVLREVCLPRQKPQPPLNLPNEEERLGQRTELIRYVCCCHDSGERPVRMLHQDESCTSHRRKQREKVFIPRYW